MVFAASLASPALAQYYWTPVFKLRNSQTSQLTAADFPGPGGTNGLVYPNWYYAGIAGGMYHITDALSQLTGRAGDRQIASCERAYVSGTGGFMSEQAALILEGA